MSSLSIGHFEGDPTYPTFEPELINRRWWVFGNWCEQIENGPTKSAWHLAVATVKTLVTGFRVKAKCRMDVSRYLEESDA